MKKQFLLAWAIITFVGLFLISCKQETQLRIVVSSDVHGLIFPYDFSTQSEAPGSLAHLATWLKQQERESLILLDNGDFLQGQPTVYFANYVAVNEPHISALVMNHLGYNGASVGNHDIEAGPKVYERLKEEFSFPWLAANVLWAETMEPYFEPYTIVEKQGVKVAVLGLCTPGVPTWLPEKLWKGLVFADMFETAQKWMPIILEKEKPDFVIGLFHSGMGSGEAETGLIENDALRIVREVTGFDLVFTGHDHRERVEKVENRDGNEVLIMGPGAHLRSISVVDVKLSKGNKKWGRNKIVSAENVRLQEFRPDTDFITLHSQYYKRVRDFVLHAVNDLHHTLNSREAFFGSSAFVDLVHRTQLAITNAEISFAAPLVFDVQIPQGLVFYRDLFRLYRYENYLYVMELSGAEIQKFLEYSYDGWINTMKREDDYMLKIRIDDDGEAVLNKESGKASLQNPFFNFDSAAGIIYEVDISKPYGERVRILKMVDGNAFSKDKKYKVAINSYRGSGGGGHLTQGSGIAHEQLAERIIWTSERDLRYEMFTWLLGLQEIPGKAIGNWKFIPEEWVLKARSRESVLLFGN